MSETYRVERGASEESYCPYCNRCYSLHKMTDEHVIPQSIGGDGRTVIRVCVGCNSKAGSIVDPLISRHSWLRAIAFCSRRFMKRQETHESTAILKDGRVLMGHCFWVEEGKNTERFALQPLKTQPDGSQWISEEACKDPVKLPAHINVYRAEMLDKASFTATPPEGAGLEPAMVKILLGMSYWYRGKEALRQAGFDAMRNCLSGTLDPRVSITWVDSLETLKQRKLPFEVKINDHTTWGECSDCQTFLGGVSLFGRVIAEIKIEGFGSGLPGRCCATENVWIPQ